jgi:uracil-DNA glycosylase family 4
MTDSLRAVAADVVGCRRCPRLVAWREHTAASPPARFRGQRYWARPLPGFGDPKATVVVLGLAPAADGGNRTGRIFTGDRSGEWLYRALHRAGYANQPTSVSRDDGLKLVGAYVCAAVRCAPPANRPTPSERDNCLGYLVRELALLQHARVVVALGSFAWDAALRAARQAGHLAPRPRPAFGHRACARVGKWWLLGSYHPSQRNTFTGTLTEQMFDGVFADAKRLAVRGSRSAARADPAGGNRSLESR